jgi:hypothetical protein
MKKKSHKPAKLVKPDRNVKHGSKATAKAALKAAAKPVVAAKADKKTKELSSGKATAKTAASMAAVAGISIPLRSTGSLKASRAARHDNNCREANCENLASSGGYCRLHYIRNWKKIKRKELILKEGKLNRYIEELVNKYPDKYIEAIRQDLATDADFANAIRDLELDETSLDYDAESVESVEGIITGIRPDVDDEGEF